jgi:hypothetical protein
VIVVLLTARAMGSNSVAESEGQLTDGTLRGSVPQASQSVSLGTETVARRDYTVSWLLVGSFRFPHNAASREGGPSVPAGQVLVTIGDVVPISQTGHWTSVRRGHHSPTVPSGAAGDEIGPMRNTRRTDPAGPALLTNVMRQRADGIGHHSCPRVQTVVARPGRQASGAIPRVLTPTPAMPGISASTRTCAPRGTIIFVRSTTPAGRRT